jgi:hypothetical protein
MTTIARPSRRLFLGTAALGFGAAVAQLAMPSVARAQSAPAGAAPTGFGPLRQVDAGLLNVGYAELGPADGRVVILLHGWPYDIHSFVDVAPRLAAAGFRVIVP